MWGMWPAPLHSKLTQHCKTCVVEWAGPQFSPCWTCKRPGTPGALPTIEGNPGWYSPHTVTYKDEEAT